MGQPLSLRLNEQRILLYILTTSSIKHITPFLRKRRRLNIPHSRKVDQEGAELMTRLQLCFLGLPLDVLYQEVPQSRTCVADERNVSLGEFVEKTHPSHRPRDLQPSRKEKAAYTQQ